MKLKKLKQIITTSLIVSSLFFVANISANAVDIKTEKENLATLEKELETTSTEISNLKNEIETKNQKLVEKKADLDKVQSEKEKQYEDAKLRIKYMYEYGINSYYESLFNSKSLSDQLNKTTYINSVINYDRQKINEYNVLLLDIKAKQKLIENEKVKLEEKKVDFESQENELKSDIESKKNLIDRLSRSSSNNSSQNTTVTYTTANNYGYSDQQLDLICAIVAQECSTSYEGALAVITCAMNRTVSSQWSYLGSDPLSQLCANGQFTYSIDGHYKKRLNGNYADFVRQAVLDAFNGARNHNYLSFRSYQNPGSVNIGGNWYFSALN